MRLIIENTPQQVAQWAANYIIAQIKNKEQHTSSPFVLGLPTSSTPLETYKELIRRHKTGEVSFKNVITFNMDEYVGLPEEHPESYHSFMWNNFFKHVDIKPENVNILDGNADDLAKECADYEARIVEAGGIDLFMGGVGEDGHIAFNDPPVADFDDPALVKPVALDEICRNQQVHDGCFATLDDVPTHALTLTVPALMHAAQVFCVVPAATKARAVRDTLLGDIRTACPASILRRHPAATLYLDADSASLL